LGFFSLFVISLFFLQNQTWKFRSLNNNISNSSQLIYLSLTEKNHLYDSRSFFQIQIMETNFRKRLKCISVLISSHVSLSRNFRVNAKCWRILKIEDRLITVLNYVTEWKTFFINQLKILRTQQTCNVDKLEVCIRQRFDLDCTNTMWISINSNRKNLKSLKTLKYC
jgi:hypothetical protein